MNDRQTLKQGLKAYYSGKLLSDMQLDALQQQLNSTAKSGGSGNHMSKCPAALKYLGSVAASIFLFMFIFAYMQLPSVVTAAYADAIKDSDLNNGMQVSMQQWLSENGIAEVPHQYPVEMSKFCRLDQYLTTHLRVAGVEQGKLHLFFHQGERPVYWLSRSGVLNKMNWKLLKIKSDLTLIVMYTDDMRETAVEQILANILPSLQA